MGRCPGADERSVCSGSSQLSRLAGAQGLGSRLGCKKGAGPEGWASMPSKLLQTQQVG